MGKTGLTENAIRSRLYRMGYKLVTTERVAEKLYAIADANNVIVTGERMTLGDVENWMNS